MALSEEDKRWMVATFATKDEAQSFATKDDLARFATKDDLARFATKDDLEKFATKEDLERVETALLTEFHKWASPMEARQRGQREMLIAIDHELDQLKQRVKNIEDRLAS